MSRESLLDTGKIRQSQHLDSFFCITYRTKDLIHEQVLLSLKDRARRETHSFRTFKPYLETRPMFH